MWTPLVVAVCIAVHSSAIQSSYNNPFLNYSDSAYPSVSFSHTHQIFHPSPYSQKPSYKEEASEQYYSPPPQVNYHSQPSPSYRPLAAPPAHVAFSYNPSPSTYGDNSLNSGYPFGSGLLRPAYPAPLPEEGCPLKNYGPCPSSKYRTIDGSCNNLKNPQQGTPNTKYNRLLPPRYSDGLHEPPTSVTGHELPSARLVSIVLFPDKPIPDPVWTLSSMQWGQIITHDMSMAMGTTQTKPYSSSQCCSSDGRLILSKQQANSHCFSIEIPADDPFYAKFGQQCMSFVRSSTDVEKGCAPPSQPHEQLVAVTQYMDASLVYGSDQQTAAALREGAGGRMKVEVRDGRQWPPPAVNKTATCANQDDDEPCYRFGDVRANQNPQLTVLQIILLREHNRLADALQQLNPHWDDERLYQEARRIFTAEYQHINYAEWLPIFIGTKNMMKYGLLYKTDGYVNDYRDDVEPNVLNSHATAAFRYFHSAIQGHIHLINEHRSAYGALRLSDYFNKPGVIEEGDNMDSLTRGLSTQNEEEIDPFLTSEITDYLFRNGMPFGRDLRAIDIQRGRDHGLASYNDFRQFCGLPRAQSFQEFGDYISPENVEKLSLLYQTTDDVDLVVGGSLEKHIKDTLTGPTFLCIMLEQFYRTRVSDRFFYESGDPSVAFTPEQLTEIRKSTVSRLLCDNGDNIQYMQPEGFRVIGEKNQLLPCNNYESIPIVDLSWWKEEPSHYSQDFPGFDFYNKK